MPTALKSARWGRLALTCTACGIWACAAVPAGQQQALVDLQFVRQTLEEHHPAFVHAPNGWATHWAASGFARARGLLEAGASASAALRYYAAGFADSHLSITFFDHGAKTDWAGIQLHYDGHHYQVVHTAQQWPTPLPPVGSQLAACDGHPADEILRTEILPLRIHNEHALFPKVWYAPDLLIDGGYLHQNRPSQCEFNHVGHSVQLPLTWQTLIRGDLLDTSRLLSLEPYQLRQIAPRIHWLSLPSFGNLAFPGTARARLASQLQELDAAQTLVFDLRGNTGGNSVFGFELARAVYGAEYLWARGQPPAEAWWRVSDGNLRYIRSRLMQSLRVADTDALMLRYVADLATAMETALQAGQALVLQPELEIARVSSTISPTASAPTGAPSVYLLTDAYCMSACLDFLELMLLDPNALHIGQETGAETAYTEVRSVPLPSRKGMLTFPQKVYPNRARDRSAPLKPALAAPSLLDTKALQQWVMDLANGSGRRP